MVKTSHDQSRPTKSHSMNSRLGRPAVRAPNSTHLLTLKTTTQMLPYAQSMRLSQGSSSFRHTWPPSVLRRAEKQQGVYSMSSDHAQEAVIVEVTYYRNIKSNISQSDIKESRHSRKRHEEDLEEFQKPDDVCLRVTEIVQVRERHRITEQRAEPYSRGTSVMEREKLAEKTSRKAAFREWERMAEEHRERHVKSGRPRQALNNAGMTIYEKGHEPASRARDQVGGHAHSVNDSRSHHERALILEKDHSRSHYGGSQREAQRFTVRSSHDSDHGYSDYHNDYLKPSFKDRTNRNIRHLIRERHHTHRTNDGEERRHEMELYELVGQRRDLPGSVKRLEAFFPFS